MQHLWWELNVWNSLDLQLNFKVIRFRASCYLRTLLCRCVVMIWSKVCQVLVTQSCLTLCDPMDYSSPGSSVHGISQARILEWVAISFSRGSSWPRDGTQSSGLQADSLLSELPGKPKMCLAIHQILSLSFHTFSQIPFPNHAMDLPAGKWNIYR